MFDNKPQNQISLKIPGLSFIFKKINAKLIHVKKVASSITSSKTKQQHS